MMVARWALFACAAAILLLAAYSHALRRRLRAEEADARRRADRADELAAELNLLIDGAIGYAIYTVDPQGGSPSGTRGRGG